MPGLQHAVALTASRQCPKCGVYVDKVTEEALLRRKVLEQERSRMAFKEERDAREAEKRVREALEKQLRDRIRKELEEEYEDGRGAAPARGSGRWLRGAAFAALLGLAFLGGHFVGGGMPQLGGDAGQQAKGQDVDGMLDRVGPKGAAADAATAAAAAANAGAPTGDADVDDPLVQAAGGKRIGAKGLSVEQAVAAAKSLGKAVGHGDPAAGTGRAGGAAASAGPDGAPAEAAALAAAAAAPAAFTLAPNDKALLVAEFARQLAELGQHGRAREVMKALRASPAAQDPQVQAALRWSGVEAAAWSLHALADAPARKGIDALLAAAAAIADPLERARVLARSATIVAQHPQLPPEAARAVLAQAAEAVKAAPEGARAAAGADWTLAQAEVLAAHTAQHARAGRGARARATAAELSALAGQAGAPAARAQLLALESQAWRHAGDPARSAQAMDAALALLPAENSVARRAAGLRELARLAGLAEPEKLQAALAAVQPLAEGQAGTERVNALAELALLHAGAGAHGRAEQLARLALATEGLTPQEAGPLQARLLVRMELAGARLYHATGHYARSDEQLRRVADYLF